VIYITGKVPFDTQPKNIGT